MLRSFDMRCIFLLASLALVGCPRTPRLPDSGPPVDAGPYTGDIAFNDVAVAAIDPSTLPAGATPCRQPILARVYEVADGDTFSAMGIGTVLDSRIRIIGVDTPEVAHPPAPADCYGDDARNFTRQLMDRVVWLTFDNTCLDPYDRLLAYVYYGPTDSDVWERQLLRRGFARHLTVGDNRTFATEFTSDEQTAQSERVGLWGVCP